MRHIVIFAMAVLVAILTVSSSAAGGEDPQPADVNCDGNVNAVDSLGLLRNVAGLNVSQQPGCPLIGAEMAGVTFGDANCDSQITSVDALAILRFVAGITSLAVCGQANLLPDEIDGVTLEQYTSDGADFLESDPAWEDVFTGMGVTADDVSLVVALAPLDSGLEFRMGLWVTEGSPWQARIDALVAGEAESPGVLALDAVSLGGKNVVRASNLTDGSAPHVYYYAVGDSLFWISSIDEATVADVLGGLPAASNQAIAAAGNDDAPPLGAFPQVLQLIQKVQPPTCVAEPYGRQKVYVMAVDGYYGVPMPYTVFTYTSLQGTLLPVTDVGPMAMWQYQAQRFGLGGPDHLQIQATAMAGGVGFLSDTFPVRHCLGGTWSDGPRILSITHSGGSVTANIQTGTLVCGEAGTAFSGTIGGLGYQFQGDNMKSCNPEECVDAGLLEKTTLGPYAAEVDDYGQDISFEWESDFYDLVYEDGNLVSCAQSSVTTESFSIHRFTFGPPPPQANVVRR